MRRASVLLLMLLSLSCVRGEWGPTKTEPGKVEGKSYMPSGHGSGTGISTRGSLVFSSVDIPARYGVMFRCQHGSFAIEGSSNSRAADVWKRVEQGQEVTIYYREFVETVKGSKDDQGAQVVTDLHFEDAR